ANVSPQGLCEETTAAGEGDPWADYQATFPASETVNGVADSYSQPLAGNFNQLKELKALYPNLNIVMSIGGLTWSQYPSPPPLGPRSPPAPAARLGLPPHPHVDQGHPAGPDGRAAGRPRLGRGHLRRLRHRLGMAGIAGQHRHHLPAAGQAGLRGAAGRVPPPAQRAQPADPPALRPDFLPARQPGHHQGRLPGEEELQVPHRRRRASQVAAEPQPNFQSNLYSDPADPSGNGYSVNEAIQQYLSRGVPGRKLVVGVPAYGRGWTGVTPGPDGNGVYQGSTGQAEG